MCNRSSNNCCELATEHWLQSLAPFIALKLYQNAILFIHFIQPLEYTCLHKCHVLLSVGESSTSNIIYWCTVLQMQWAYIHYFSVASCGFLDLPWGKVNTTATIVGTAAFLSCSERFVFAGDSARQCTPTLDWSGNVSVCEGKY